jgi:hypothetical protein
MNDIEATSLSSQSVPLVIISPVRDESALIEKTLQSMVSQSI